MKKNILINSNNKGITLIALVIMIIILFILAGITIGNISSDDGIIEQTEEQTGESQRETLIQKIQADLLEETTKKGRPLTQEEKENVILNYGEITEDTNDEKILVTTQGNYKILLSEIII